MLQVKVKNIGQIEYEETKPPARKKNEVIIQVKAVGICGSDVHIYLGENPVLKPPRIPGHEFGGIIKEIGVENKGFKVGDKVVVNPMINCRSCYYCLNELGYLCESQKFIGGDLEGCMKEEIAVPIENIIKLDDSFDLNYAPFIEPTAVALHSVGKIKNSNVLIIGLSTIGLLIQQICLLNNNKIIGTDISDYSLKISQKLKSNYTVNSKDEKIIEKIEKFMGKEKIDIIFDCVCLEETVLMSTKLIKKGGTIVCIGIPPGKFNIDIVSIICKEIKLESRYLYKNTEFMKSIDLILEEKIDIKMLVSRIFPLKKAKEAYEYKVSKPSIKIILNN